jgi:alpha-tubulin suppressor-like RCC1 family protein
MDSNFNHEAFRACACRGDFGRLGHGDCNDVFIPQAIDALAGKRVLRMACGDTHTLAVTASGELFSFGRNQNGQLGLGTTSDAITPQPVEALKVASASSPLSSLARVLMPCCMSEIFFGPPLAHACMQAS